MPHPYRRRIARASALASPPVPRPVRYLIQREAFDGTVSPSHNAHAAAVAVAEANGFRVVTWRVVRVNAAGDDVPPTFGGSKPAAEPRVTWRGFFRRHSHAA